MPLFTFLEVLLFTTLISIFYLLLIFSHAKLLAPVVQTSDSAIHRINHYPADSVLISGILIRWIVIYPVDSAIQRLNNRGLV